MAWDATTVTGTRIVAVTSGGEQNFNFDGATKLKDVVRQVTSQLNIGSAVVKVDGRVVEPSEGETAISGFHLVEIAAKYSGAADELEASTDDELADTLDESSDFVNDE